MREEALASTIGFRGTQQAEPTCRLQGALGTVAGCPRELCAFWEPGGAVVEGRCLFERVDLQGRTELASWLLGIRARLETSVGASEVLGIVSR
jgi:hypothetical protein